MLLIFCYFDVSILFEWRGIDSLIDRVYVVCIASYVINIVINIVNSFIYCVKSLKMP